MTKLCGATIPPALYAELDRRRDDDAAVPRWASPRPPPSAWSCSHGGAPGIHFYTLTSPPRRA